MSLITAENFGVLFLGPMLSIVPFLLCVLVMHFLMPKAVLAPMRSWMFMGVIAFPRLGKKRKITDIHQMVSSWCRITSVVLVIWLTTALAGIVSILIGLLFVLSPSGLKQYVANHVGQFHFASFHFRNDG